MGKNARTYGQDLMRGEHKVGGGMSKQRLAPGGGGAWLGGQETASSKKYGRAVGTTEWMNSKGLTGGCSDGDPAVSSGTSIFDPVLTELCYRWFCPKGGRIIDPFAGGSVRGLVASILGYIYQGCELRPEQVAANEAQAHLCGDVSPLWVCDDSKNIGKHFNGGADFVFSCPPYADLEVYSDDPRDISAMPYADFLDAYRKIIAESCGLLAENRFACFVVGEARDKRGNYYNLVGDTIDAFRAAGMHYYNEAVLVTAVGSLPVRVGKQFKASRKIGKTHQNVLVFVKGDGKAAAKNIEASL